MACEYHTRLSIAFDLAPPSPDFTPGSYATEPISHGMIYTHLFIFNAKGYPVLPKMMQPLVWSPSRLTVVPTISLMLSHADVGLHTIGGGEVFSSM